VCAVQLILFLKAGCARREDGYVTQPLLEQIATRRLDADFQRRLRKILERDRLLLDRLSSK
jgi:hypothetical protein